jgi:putative SOS response-associated peptidase YedK
MCGLFSFRKAPEETRNLFNYLETPDFPPRQYVTPGGPIAIVTANRDGRHYLLVRWGLIPSWVKEVKPGKPLINARSETILEKPSFRNAMKRRRCLIPADGFYEWEGDIPGKKRPFFIHREDDGLFAFAGIWDHWMGADGSELESAAIITTTPNAEISRIHDRSPVVIHPQDFAKWLDHDNVDAKEAAELLVPPPDDYFILEQTHIERKTPPPKPKPDKPKKDIRNTSQTELF